MRWKSIDARQWTDMKREVRLHQITTRKLEVKRTTKRRRAGRRRDTHRNEEAATSSPLRDVINRQATCSRKAEWCSGGEKITRRSRKLQTLLAKARGGSSIIGKRKRFKNKHGEAMMMVVVVAVYEG